MYKEFRAINVTSSRKNVWNMLVGKIFFFDLKFVVFLKSVFCVWNRGVNDDSKIWRTVKLRVRSHNGVFDGDI